jgi:hypothetical protein
MSLCITAFFDRRRWPWRGDRSPADRFCWEPSGDALHRQRRRFMRRAGVRSRSRAECLREAVKRKMNSLEKIFVVMSAVVPLLPERSPALQPVVRSEPPILSSRDSANPLTRSTELDAHILSTGGDPRPCSSISPPSFLVHSVKPPNVSVGRSFVQATAETGAYNLREWCISQRPAPSSSSWCHRSSACPLTRHAAGLTIGSCTPSSPRQDGCTTVGGRVALFCAAGVRGSRRGLPSGLLQCAAHAAIGTTVSPASRSNLIAAK